MPAPRQLRAQEIVIVSVFALLLAAQAGWAVATTSGTYDETTYLRLGRGLFESLDGAELASWGVAPLPVLLTSAVPVLAGAQSYPRAITLARVSAIMLFGVPFVVITYWTLRQALGMAAARAGAAFVSLSPNIVAHASLATTDVCFVAAALVALAALTNDLERPSRRSRALLAGAMAVALAAKYSALVLFPIVALASFAWNARRSPSPVRRAMDALTLAMSLFGIALLFVWALHALAMVPFGLAPIEFVRLPASLVGIARQLHHQSLGEPSFLMGHRSPNGWWYYMPAALAMKSTAAELLIGGCALAAVVRWHAPTPSGAVWRMAFVAFAGAGLVNHLALGVRYELILIPLSTFLAAEWWFGANDVRRWRSIAAGAVVVLQLFSAMSIAPHYLSYFNAFAGGPENGYTRLADSNVDWGQDLPALRAALARVGAKRPLLSYFGTAPVDAYDLHIDRWDDAVPRTFERYDWVAISATNLDGVFLPADPFVGFRGLTPGARAGYSILLYPTDRDDVRKAMAIAAGRMR